MPYALSIIKVKDYAKFKSEFDREDGIALRKAGEMKSYQLFPTEDDPNTVVLLTEFDNLDKARKFIQSEELQEASQQSGVVSTLGIYYLGEMEKGSV
jgi:uncharacterized protein (DUF1330 family)